MRKRESVCVCVSMCECVRNSEFMLEVRRQNVHRIGKREASWKTLQAGGTLREVISTLSPEEPEADADAEAPSSRDEDSSAPSSASTPAVRGDPGHAW